MSRVGAVGVGAGLAMVSALVGPGLVGLGLPALASPGDPVPSYGVHGVTVTNSGTGALDVAAGSGFFFDVPGPAAARQADGSLVVATQTSSDAVVVRYTPSGALDTGFGDGGTAVVDFGGQDRARAVAIDGAGRIVVAGSTLHPDDPRPARSAMAVLRLLPDGAPDPSFHGGTAVVQGWEHANMAPAAAVALQADGRIVVAGYENLMPTSMLFERLMPDGSLDPTFSGDGLATLGAGAIAGVTSLAVTGTRIVAAGAAQPAGGGGADVVVAELNASGEPVAGFGSGGVVTTDLGGEDQADAVAVDADGKLLVAADADAYGDPHGVVLRYTAAGALDPSFSGDGRAAPGGLVSARGVAPGPDGSVLVAGAARDDNFNPEPAAARLTSAGTPDASFGTGGVQTYAGDALGTRGSAVFATAGGSVTLVGLAQRYQGPDVPALLRWRADGTRDPAFGTDGLSLPQPTAPAVDTATASATTPDGGLVVVGTTTGVTTGQDVLLVRYTSTGQLDPSFDGDGIKTLDLGGDDLGADVAVQGDGRIVVAAAAGGHATVLRLTPTGALDDTFSGDGRWTHDPDNVVDTDGASAVTIAPDGDIVLAGTGWTPGAPGQMLDIEAMRLHPDGTPVAAFSGDGVVSTDAGGLNGSDYRNDRASAVAALADGSVLVAGYAYRTGSPSADAEMTVVHYLADGSLDPAFGHQGIATPDVLAQGSTWADAMAVDGSGRIVLSGATMGLPHVVVARFTPAGALDTTFAQGGRWIGDAGEATSVALAPDGRIVAGTDGGRVVRLLPDGAPDPSFGDDGVAVVDGGEAGVSDVHVAPGAVLATGTTYGDVLVAAVDGSTPATHLVSVTLAGSEAGHVTGPGIDCPGDCSQAYAAGRTLTLTATPANADSVFGGWSGTSCAAASCEVTVDSDLDLTATFEEVQRVMTVTVVGHGRVTGNGIDCPDTCSRGYPTGSFFSLSARPDPGYRLQAWSGDCSGTGECQADMTADRAVTATFVALPPPDTAITAVKVDSAHHRATVTIAATGKGKPFTFECALDGGDFAPCTSPATFRKLKPGRHTVAARALSATGAADTTPATKSFRVAR